jgi:hypothetical protein
MRQIGDTLEPTGECSEVGLQDVFRDPGDVGEQLADGNDNEGDSPCKSRVIREAVSDSSAKVVP